MMAARRGRRRDCVRLRRPGASGIQQLQASKTSKVTVGRAQCCSVLEREGRKSRVRHKRPAHLRIGYMPLKDLPEPIAGPNDRYVKAIEPGVNYSAGIGTRQRLAYCSRVRRYAHESEQCLPRKGNRFFGIKRGVEPRAAN